MDTLNAISPYPYLGSGLAQAPPPKNEESGGSVKAVAVAVAAVVATATAAIQVKLPEPKDQGNKQQISNAVKDINNFFQMAQRSLGFSLDETSGQMVMQIKDTETNEVIRQIPGEDALKLAKQLDQLTGILFKAQA
jgi:flagellar protein FlaG